MDADKYVGRLLDNRYEIQANIGTGGMAVVYKARDYRLNRLVAIKILKDEYSQDEDFKRRFHAESQAVAMLSHPNIVSIHDVSSFGGVDYIVMELIDGISLKQYMEKKGVLNWKETLHFAMQIAKALEHAHSRGIVHRDIKPHNVMVLKNGSVKVADFGIARIMSKGNTLTKEALGSVHYISPEQAKGGRVDNRSDIYSLGVVMYEMMSGRPPYDGESPVAVAIQHINGGAPMPSTLNPNIPGGLEQIIMKAMAHEPNNRYDTATAMLYDMEEFRKDPTILFDYQVLLEDAPVQVPYSAGVVAEPANQPLSTAERVAERRGEQPRLRRDPPVSRSVSHETEIGNSRVNTGTGSVPRRSTGTGRGTQRTETDRQESRRRQEAEEAEKRNRMATIAIIVCSLVAVFAIAVFLMTLLGGGIGSSEDETIQVPNLLGEVYDPLKDYGDFIIRVRDWKNSDEYEQGQIMYQNPEAGDILGKGREVYVDISLGKEEAAERKITNLVGMRRDAAESFLNSLEMNLNIVCRDENSAKEKDTVIRTDPFDGQTLTEGQDVILYLSTGRMAVPYVEGLSISEAKAKLNDSGFNNVTERPVDSDKPEGTVVTQSVRADTETDVTTNITLEVSNGTVKAEVPNVVGRKLNDAIELLKSHGFNNFEVNHVDSNKPVNEVVRQSVNPYTKVDVTTKIILEVSNGPTEPPTTAPPPTQPPTTPPSQPPATQPPTEETEAGE